MSGRHQSVVEKNKGKNVGWEEWQEALHEALHEAQAGGEDHRERWIVEEW